MLWQRHHVAPCVGLGLASPADRWCTGCVTFTGTSDAVALEDEAEAHRQARQRSAAAAPVHRARRR